MTVHSFLCYTFLDFELSEGSIDFTMMFILIFNFSGNNFSSRKSRLEVKTFFCVCLNHDIVGRTSISIVVLPPRDKDPGTFITN